MRRPTRDRRALRAWSALLCALFVVAQLASFAHEALSSHVVCAEHGELVHVGHFAPATAGHRAHAPAERQLLGVSDPSVARDHEHCGLAAVSRERALQLQAHTSVATAPACSRAPFEVPANPDRSSIPVFRLAPKQSPPA